MSENLYISETHRNVTEGYRMGDVDPYESYLTTAGDAFRAMRKEYGRCTGKVYYDSETGPQAIGWVFLKLDRYEDTREPFLHETWITLHTGPDTVVRTPHYHHL